MTILFLHGWYSVPGGVKPSYLTRHGHEVINPALDDDDFAEAVLIAQAEYDRHHPHVIVGSSRGGAVAMNLDSGSTPLVLLCPAWRRWGMATAVKPGTMILHSEADDVIPIAESRELVRASGLPESALVVLGTDHRLADPEPLAAMLEAASLSVPTLCLGIDVSWWGGLPRIRDSQRDTIVYALLDGEATSDLGFSLVDLSTAPNPDRKLPTEPNFDPDGRLLVDAIKEILSERIGGFRRCVISLDAPLEALHRSGQPPRVKAAGKGVATGSKRRECEDQIQKAKQSQTTSEFRAWNAGLKIQPGSPVPARLSRVLRTLETEADFSVWRTGSRASPRDVIEIFPSEAIWSLGLNGYFTDRTSEEVRCYKSKGSLSIGCAMEQAIGPLSGFERLFQERCITRLPVRRWIENIAEYSCRIASDPSGSTVRKGKGFDDPIESGIALLTGVLFLTGVYHEWGDGTDGTILGPGRFQSQV
jgi:hypothetical protein